MNERIKELALQAWRYADDNSRDGDGTHGWLYRDKFAELIVRECSKIIVNGGYWSGGPLGPKRQCTPPEIANMITEHFGVKE